MELSSPPHSPEATCERSRPGYLDVNSRGSLPRVDSTASFIAEACHIEDVDAGCQIHSHPSDIGLSRHYVDGSSAGGRIPKVQEGGGHTGSREENKDSLPTHDQIPPETHHTKWTPSAINPDQLSLERPATPIIVPPTPQFPLHKETLETGATLLLPQNGTTPPVGSGSDAPRRSSGEINWAFDDMNELLKRETGELTRENVQAYGEQQGRAVSPIDRANTPPAPPKVVSKPQPDSSSDVEEEGGLVDRRSPFDDEEIAGDAAIFSSIFTQAGTGIPGTQQELPTSIFDSVNVENSNVDESDFFNTLGGGDRQTNTQDETKAQWEEGLSQVKPLAREPVFTEEQQAPVSFLFDEPGDYEGGDFFSTAGNSQTLADDPQRKSKSEVVAAALVGTHYGGVAASVTTAISEVFGTADETLPEGANVFASSIQVQSDTETGAMIGSGETDIAAKWQAALAADELLDDDFLPDDEGFLSSDQEEDSAETTPAELKPVVNSSGVLQGFSNITTTSAPPATSRYTPQSTTPPIHTQGPYHTIQNHYSIPTAGWQPQPNPHTLAQQPSVTQPYGTPQPLGYTPALAATGYYTPIPASAPPRQFQAAPPKPPPVAKAQSFVDKKGNYQSPYDLPMEVVKPALSKRISMPRMSPSLTSPPHQQSSFGTGATPPTTQSAFGPPLQNTPPGAPAANILPPKVSTKPAPAFFEDLPMVTKVKPTRYQPQVVMAPSESLPGTLARPMSAANTAYQPTSVPTTTPSLGPAPALHSRYAPPPTSQTPSQIAHNYVAPPQPPPAYVDPPQATATTAPQYPAIPPTPPTTSHYTTASAIALPPIQGLISPPQFSPYHRVPSTPLPNTCMESKYVAKPVVALQQSPPRQKQVSAPLISGSDGASTGSPQQSQQNSHNQMRHFGEQHHFHSSRPGTAKSAAFAAGFGALKEEDEAGESAVAATPPPAVICNKYGPRSTATPPPPSGQPMRGMSRANTLSPPSRTASPVVNSAIQQQHPSRTASPESFAPPRRAQTQSPSTLMNGPKRPTNQYQPSQHLLRPASALAGNATSAYPGFSPIEQHTRSVSAGVKNFMNDPVNFMTPQDTSIHDPLNRWQGCPIFSWGFGGHIVTMFPTRTQRNAVGMSQPMIKCSPGEVKVRHTRDILPLEDSLVKFPGPVYSGGKGAKLKKKEVLAWMAEKIAALEGDASGAGMFLPGEPIPDETERKRKEEKILLWKGMKMFLENDGNIEGGEIGKSIRAFLWPEDSSPTSADSFSLVASMSSSATGSGLGPVPDRVNMEAMKTIRTHLLNGDRTAAVWHAVDKRLWSHAMLIAGTVSNDLWKQVVQDFVKNEVKTLGGGLESLAVLYEIFGGNGEESVDELVPQSARLGQPMMTSMTGTVSAKDPLEGLEKWRETLALIMSNRSAGDTTAITALGKLLGTYARVEAAHLCYLFAKNAASFSGSDDPNTAVALFGADHVYSPFTFWKDTDAILLSEVYELALSLAPGPTPPAIIPHLQGIKVFHAFLLAESGYGTEAHKYCDAIGSVLKTSTKPLPYFHRTMFNALEELTNRVSQSPKDAAAGGWLSKPSLDNISGSMWGAFTKFVAGEDSEPGPGTDNGQAAGVLAQGPFGGTSTSPGMSRTQSIADIYGYGGSIGIGGGNHSPTIAKQFNFTAAATPYTPQQQPVYSSQPPGSSGKSYDPSSPYAPYTPLTNTSTTNAYKPVPTQQTVLQSLYASGSQQSPYMSQSGYEPSPIKPTFDSPTPYQGSFVSPAASKTTFSEASSGYQPLSYEPPSASSGYEPPAGDTSYQPHEARAPSAAEDKDSDDEKPKPKKKSFMDDDDDDAEFLARAAALKKEAEEKKKKQEEEEKKKQAAASGGSGWFKGWFGGKKDPNGQSGGPIKAKLGEESSFYYDPDLKRWINKKAAAEEQAAPKGPPIPPKRLTNPPSRPSSAVPPPQTPTSAGPHKSFSTSSLNMTSPPPTSGSSDAPSTPISAAPAMRASTPGTPAGQPMRTGTPSTPAPPSRLGTPAPSTPGTPGSLPPMSASAPPPPGAVGRSAPPSRPSTADRKSVV